VSYIPAREDLWAPEMNVMMGTERMTSTREMELRRAKLFGYALGISLIVLTVLVIVLLY